MPGTMKPRVADRWGDRRIVGRKQLGHTKGSQHYPESGASLDYDLTLLYSIGRRKRKAGGASVMLEYCDARATVEPSGPTRARAHSRVGGELRRRLVLRSGLTGLAARCSACVWCACLHACRCVHLRSCFSVSVDGGRTGTHAHGRRAEPASHLTEDGGSGNRAKAG